MGLLEAAQHWDQPGDRQRWRQRQAHGGAIGGRQDGLRRCLDLPDRRIDALKVPPPDLGQRQVPARAIEQLGLQKALELPHLMADGGLGDAKALGGLRDAIVGGRRAEGQERTEGWKPVPESAHVKIFTVARRL